MTKKKHKTGTDRIFEAYKKIEKKINCKYIINLQGDEPFINPRDIRKLNKIITRNKSNMGTIATKIEKSQLTDKSVVKVATEDNILKREISKAKKFMRSCKTLKISNIYSHIGVYQFKVSILKKFVNLRQSKNEIKHRLEQLRAIDNDIDIHVVYSKNKSIGIDTAQDYVEIKKIIEYKI